jgi:glycosyltransferase involved in cell wall biosynthesis
MSRTRRLIDRCTRDGAALRPVARNEIWADFVRSRTARDLRARFATFPVRDRVRLRAPRPDPDPERQGWLIVLKSPTDEPREKGVILVMYHEGIEAAAAVLDLRALASQWQFVLETSNWGAQDARYLPWIGSDLEVVVMMPRADDFRFVQGLGTNLVPTRVGSGQWVDPSVFTPKPADEPLQWDVAMVASWDPLKRHAVLFDALADLRRRGRDLKTILVGIPAAWTRERVEALVRERGLEDLVTFRERIPHAEVARIVARSGVSVLLSKQEGSNRAVYESFFVGTPAVVYAQHRGIDLDHVNRQTGLLAEDADLADALLRVLESRADFDPAGYAHANLGFANATRTLNAALRECAERAGRRWVRDIAAKRNAPNLFYAAPGAWRTFEADYDGLASALLPLP